MEAKDKANEYVLGFMFNKDKSRVVLIKKEKPTWQKGRLNGVGGKVKEDELAYSAMIREFEEETGFHFEGWREFAVMHSTEWKVECFYGISDEAFDKVETKTEEQVVIIATSELQEMVKDGLVIENLGWLILLALDRNVEKGMFFYK